MTALGRSEIEGLDSGTMLGDVLDQPAQLTDALWRAESAGMPARDAPMGLVVCGMGGSAVGGDLAAAAIGSRARRPIRVVRGYDPAPLAGDGALVLCASYSGETEETLACYTAAAEAGAPRVVLTTGGALAAAARRDGAPVIGAPAGLQPRAAVAYMVVAALACADACGAAPPLREEVEAASRLLEELRDDWGPDGPDGSQPKALASALHGTIPVVYGAAGPAAAAAGRWKTQLNENAKVHAFVAELPEADHNEVCAWDGDPPAPLRAVFLEDPAGDRRLHRRTELTAGLAEESGAGVDRVAARGETALERVMSLVFFGDLVSVYLAALERVDPTPTPAIDRLKRALASAGADA